jgi:hypothetical protein
LLDFCCDCLIGVIPSTYSVYEIQITWWTSGMDRSDRVKPIKMVCISGGSVSVSGEGGALLGTTSTPSSGFRSNNQVLLVPIDTGLSDLSMSLRTHFSGFKKETAAD